MDNPSDLVGCFVVEVGERQAWPFVTFCDNRATPPREARLYIDTLVQVESPDSAAVPDGPVLVQLLALNNLSVTGIEQTSGSIVVAFDNGSRLRVSGEAEKWTTGDVWWFGPWRT